MNIAAITACIVLAILPIGFTLGVIIYGKIRLRRALRPVEYYPPRGYSPIDVIIKYYGHRANMHSLINPMMLYWASRGFITIEEDCRRGLKLTKLKNLEAPCERITKGQAKNFKIEKKLFDELFLGGKVFYTLAAHQSYNDTLKSFMSACRKSARDATPKKSFAFMIASLVSAVVSLIAISVIVGTSLDNAVLIAMLFPIVGMIAFNAIPNDGGFETMLKFPFFAVWGGAPFAVVVSSIPRPESIILGLATAASFLIISVFARRIDIRSDSSVDIYGRICAFKTFLLQAETDRLETLIEDDPNYYYDILPYCYILKLTKKLKPKFDRIALDGPSWYLGDLRDILMF